MAPTTAGSDTQRPGGTRFLVERYLNRSDRRNRRDFAAALRRSAGELTREGTPVRYVRSIFLPGDETCFDLYVASSAEAVGEAVTRAGVPFERVVRYEE